MADKGIIFSAPMVRALLAGRKTQTRRLLSSAPSGPGWNCDPDRRAQSGYRFVANGGTPSLPCTPPYAPGDRLYLREHWKTTPAYDDLAPSDMGGDEPLLYLADSATFNWAEADGPHAGKHRQGMHMPRWASRLWLAVTEVRVQRLQDISETDANAEGIYFDKLGFTAGHIGIGGCNQEWSATPEIAYANLWRKLHTQPGTTWADNPWIVAVTFAVHKGNIDG